MAPRRAPCAALGGALALVWAFRARAQAPDAQGGPQGAAGGAAPALSQCAEPPSCVWPAWVLLETPEGEFTGFKELTSWEECLAWCEDDAASSSSASSCCEVCAKDAACEYAPPESDPQREQAPAAASGLVVPAGETPPESCPADYFKGCDGWCILESKLGDGECNIDAKADLSCRAFNYDSGDCVPPITKTWDVWGGGDETSPSAVITEEEIDPFAPLAVGWEVKARGGADALAEPGPEGKRASTVHVRKLPPSSFLTFRRTDEIFMAGNYSLAMDVYVPAPLAAAGQDAGTETSDNPCAQARAFVLVVPASGTSEMYSAPLADHVPGGALPLGAWARASVPIVAFNSGGMFEGPKAVHDRFGVMNPTFADGACELYLDAIALEPNEAVADVTIGVGGGTEGTPETQGAPQPDNNAQSQQAPPPPQAQLDDIVTDSPTARIDAAGAPTDTTESEQVHDAPDGASSAATTTVSGACISEPDEWPFCPDLVKRHSCTSLTGNGERDNLTVLIALHCRTSCGVCSPSPPQTPALGPIDGEQGDSNSSFSSSSNSGTSAVLLGVGIGLISLGAVLLLLVALFAWRLRRRWQRQMGNGALPKHVRMERTPSDVSATQLQALALDLSGIHGGSPAGSRTLGRSPSRLQQSFLNPVSKDRTTAAATCATGAVAVASAANAGVLAGCQWAIPFEELRFVRRIGIGVQGEVFHAVWNGHTDVAVKRFFSMPAGEGEQASVGRQLAIANPLAVRGSSGEEGGGAVGAAGTAAAEPDDPLARLRAEVDVLVNLRHPNIVLALGACEVSPNLCLVMEYCPRGSLDRLLRDAAQGGGGGRQLDRRRRVRIALQAARGIAYLHSLSPPVVHRDIKPGNLLVTSNYDVKVADFGLSRMLEQSIVSRASQVGTVGYMAPEVLRSERGTSLSTRCDVWSYGVVLVEILTGTPPYSHHESPVQCMVAVACHGERPRLPESMRQDEAGVRLGRLCDACTELEPRMRPGFGPIVEELTAVSALLTPPTPRTPGDSRSASPREPPLPRPPSGAGPFLG